MKKDIFSSIAIVAMVITISFSAKSQSFNSNAEGLQISNFDLSPIGKGFSTKNTVLLGESDFVKKFGKPISKSIEYAEMEEKNMVHYIYSGAQAWYLDNQLEALEFTSPQYVFILSNHNSIKVGDQISLVTKNFPSSWMLKTSNRVFVNLLFADAPVDTTLLFEFDENTRKIKSISINN